jgi:hypothetical protein
MRKTLLATVVAFLALGVPLASADVVDIVAVNGDAAPWSVSANSKYDYVAFGAAGAAASAVVNVVGYSSVSLAASGTVTEAFYEGYGDYFSVSGIAPTGVYSNDGNKYYGTGNSPYVMTGWGPDADGRSNSLPSNFIETSNTGADILWGALLATFVNGNGVIVGTPFAPGLSDQDIAVPTGATELLLGVNEDYFGAGTSTAWTVTATLMQGGVGGGVPEAPTYLMGLLGMLALGALGARRARA